MYFINENAPEVVQVLMNGWLIKCGLSSIPIDLHMYNYTNLLCYILLFTLQEAKLQFLYKTINLQINMKRYWLRS